MKFNIPHAIASQEIRSIISKEIKKQQICLYRLTKKHLSQLVEITEAIEKKELPDFLVRKRLSQELGYGIFLHPEADPILKGQVIAPYAGEISIIPQTEPDDSTFAFDLLLDIRLEKQDHIRLDKKRLFHPRRLYSLKLDALKKGNFTRFINHSEKPNVVAHLTAIPHAYGLNPSPLEVIYFAKKTIRPGEQLLVSYEDGAKNYWGAFHVKPVSMTPQTFRLSPSLKFVE